jgi:hypothetical protein
MRFLPSLILAALLIFGSALPSFGQAPGATTIPNSGPVLVYRITFSGAQDSLNFRGYTGGYYFSDVASTPGSTGTLILLQVVGGVRKYYQTNSFGTLYYAAKGKDRKAVIVGTTATNTTAVTNTTFYLTGKADSSQEVAFANAEAKFFTSKELKGTAIFCDSQEDLPFAYAPGESFGTAAQVNIAMKMDEAQTAYSTTRAAGRSDMVTKVVSELVSDGYSNGNATPAPTPGGAR